MPTRSSESDFEPVSDQGKAGDGAGKHAGEDEPRKDANGYYVGLKCKCRWNEMRFKHYNCTITAVHENVEDPSKNTYDVLFDDSDTNEDVPLERMSLERVQPAYDRWAKPTLMQMGFHGDNLKREDGRITVEMVHWTAKPQSVYSHTPMKGLVQWPLVLSMRRNITGDQLHNLVWSQVDRFVTPAEGWIATTCRTCSERRLGRLLSERGTKSLIHPVSSTYKTKRSSLSTGLPRA